MGEEEIWGVVVGLLGGVYYRMRGCCGHFEHKG